MPLPSLNSLRTFESAARLKSFSQAAQELFVSPSAVSHQIRQLEQRLGVELFVRLDRQVVLSPAGERYYPQVKVGIETLLNATAQLLDKSDDKPAVIKMSVVPFFATRWLLPKLEDFRALYPHWQLKMQTSTVASDFTQEGFDLVIRRGTGPWPGMVGKLLCHERLAAVCHPNLVARVTSINDLLALPLLINAKVMSEWREWFESQQQTFKDPALSFDFQNTAQILDACLSGAGVALIDPVMISQELSQGKLVNLFDSSVVSLRQYFLVYPKAYQRHENIQLFEQWIFEKMAKDPLMSDRIPKS
ncbi:MAG: LysR family transcriptional regulator [Oceanospirillaceae bacterium]|nr:LysR family transcriptional regulator [Oceanospirillaceae bacterium]